MQPYPLRLPDQLREELQAEAEEEGLDLAAYIRRALQDRNTQETTQQDTQELAAAYPPADYIEDSLTEHENRLTELETELHDLHDQLGKDEIDLPETSTSEIEDALQDWTPGRGYEEREEKQELGRIVLAWVREQSEPVGKQEITSALYDDHDLGISERPWWEGTVREALHHARDRGYVREAGHGRYEWIGE